METIQNYYRVDRRDICRLRFILEGYDGMALMTTVDSHQGIVLIRIAPGCEDDMELILDRLKEDMRIEPVDL